ncbi:MAG: hypothetical protein GX328_03660 [Clostridiaceae bacterium]|nr:hypothetical protein [Clostridiaceae bacterium]
MLKKRIERILGTVTLALLLAVVSVYFLRSANNEESTDFLAVNKLTHDQSIDTSDSKVMADLDSIKLDTLADRYVDNFNRSLNTIPEKLKINVKEIRDVEGELELDLDSIRKHDKNLLKTDLVIEEELKIDSEIETQVENIAEQPIMLESSPEAWVEPEAPAEVPTEPEPEIPAEEPTKTEVQTESPTESEVPVEVPAEPEIPNETEAPTETTTEPSVAPAVQSIQFVSPGSTAAAATNHSLIAGLIKPNGKASYYNFTENGDGTITVDGYTFAYTGSHYSTITGYDGIECSGTGIPNKTASGLATTRGLAATVFPKYGGYPFGTVLFIEGYGLVVVADYNGMGEQDSSWLDVCYYDGELATGIDPGRSTSRVFILATN